MKNNIFKKIKQLWDDFWLVNPEDKLTYRAAVIGGFLFFSGLILYVLIYGK